MEIAGNKMLGTKDDSFLLQCESNDCKKLNISKKKKFTIVEGLKLFEIMSTNNSDTLNKKDFWQRVHDNKYIPERGADLMRKFWQKYESYTVEQWLVKAIHENLDFSLSVKQIPSLNFVKNFRIKYEMEFLRLESMEPLGERMDTSHNLGRNIVK